MMIYIFLVIFLFLIVCVLGYKLYKFSLLILEIEDTIEECLDELDKKYQSIGKILQQEIFFDSVEIRQVIADIKESHTSILKIANKLTETTQGKNEIKKED